jgi:hypothetical protein
MMEFRFYSIGPDDKIRSTQNLDAGSLEDAVARARKLAREGAHEAFELWHGAALIHSERIGARSVRT